MHSIVRQYLRASLAFLLLGLVLGAWLLVRRELTGRWASPLESSAHLHALLSGFMMFMIMGVALWLFPRPAKDDRWYRPGLVRAAWWVLVPATLARVFLEWAAPVPHAMWASWGLVAAGVSQVLGFVLFFGTMWSRIRPVGSQVREAAGERF